ncbi:hypothetical protein QVD17_06840 [Tagetes erecta]|uniref:Uncharacterized protein n=1 Tax=Tagetes erecta TaxID=13708 RepID=A0AAD8PC51_TARER|nr:hypothetical protein QVD17_06840 [Tagetes erecta]
MGVLEEFKDCSGLVPSIAKSTVYFCNVGTAVKREILNITPFEEGKLPVRYLGVPLVSSRLLQSDCVVLTEKMDSRIEDWKNKSLSYAGRLQLIRSVLSSLFVYWASVLVLPMSTISELERKMRSFLWGKSVHGKVRAKVDWGSVCFPVSEGGLGIRKIVDMNKALMSSHIWSIINCRKSIWVDWIHVYKLKGNSIWEVPVKRNMSYGWRKILQLRVDIRQFIWRKIGNGERIHVWSDNWCSYSPLRQVITPREIYRAGFDLNGFWVKGITLVIL